MFDLDEAVEWVAADLPFEVSAQLSHEEVRQLLTWSLEHLATPLVPTGVPILLAAATAVVWALRAGGRTDPPR